MDSFHEFRRTGLLRLPGAVPAADASAMVDRISEHLDRLPSASPTGPIAGLRAITAAPEFRALGSASIVGALDDLLGAGRWEPPRRWGRLLVTFPSAGPWDLPTGSAWHNDFVPLRAGPGDRAVQLFTILKDLPPRGGGTLVLTGSHRLVARYIAETGEAPHPRRVRPALTALRDLWEPSEDRVRRYLAEGVRVDDVDLRVVELTGRAGDAFVMHCDTFHAAAPNRATSPRMMATAIVLRA
jgi:hypothetical protein